MKYSLSIETTGTYLGLSLYSFSLSEKSFDRRQTFFVSAHHHQSDLLIPELDRLLRREKISKTKLALIAVDAGPGSFTGVRVGVAAARAISQGLRLPLVGVNSLEAVAYEEAKKKRFDARFLVVPLPALANEIYGAVYEVKGNYNQSLIGGHLKEVLAPCWGPIAAFKLKLKKYKLTLPPDIPRSPHPDAIAEIAIGRFFRNSNFSFFHYSKMKPFYLQPSWAERSRLGK